MSKRINSRTKGAEGERQWAKWLRDNLGCEGARRGRQFRGTPDSPDVADGIAHTHPEVKRVERLELHKAMAQAIEESGEGEVPYVASRRNRDEWIVTVRASDLARFAELVYLQAMGG